jgi:hypothetical protein
MNHRVAIFDADAISAIVRLREVHYGVVRVPVCPVALPFQSHREGRHWFCSRLDNTTHRIVMCELVNVAAAVFDHVNLVAIVGFITRGPMSIPCGVRRTFEKIANFRDVSHKPRSTRTIIRDRTYDRSLVGVQGWPHRSRSEEENGWWTRLLRVLAPVQDELLIPVQK